MMVCSQAWAALVLLSAAPAASVRVVEDADASLEGQAAALQGLDFQGYCPEYHRTHKMKRCSQLEDDTFKSVCSIILEGKHSLRFIVPMLEKEKCLRCSVKEVETKCAELLQPLTSPSHSECVALHHYFPKNDAKCANWNDWLRYSAKRAQTRFKKKPGTFVEACYRTEGNLGSTLCQKYTEFCDEDARTEADKAQCDGWKFKTIESDGPVWKNPYQVARSHVLSEATTDADKCLKAFHDTFADIIVSGENGDKAWTWFKSSGCKSFDDFVSGTKSVRRHFPEVEGVEEGSCQAGSNMLHIICRAYAGFCTAAEGSDLFSLPISSLEGGYDDHKCNTISWE